MGVTRRQQSRGNVRCSACATSSDSSERDRLFETAESLWVHVIMDHLFWLPYECFLCPTMCMPTKAVLRRHFDQAHGGKVPKALYTYDEKKKMEANRIFDESQKLSNGVESIAEGLALVTNSTDSLLHSVNLAIDNRSPSPKKRKHGSRASSSTNKEQNGRNVKQRSESFRSIKRSPLTNSYTANTVSTDRNVPIEDDMTSKKVTGCRVCHRPNIKPSRRHSHIWLHHMVGRRYTCNLCVGHGNNMLWHMRGHARIHHGKSAEDVCWTDNTDALADEYGQAYLSAYGHHSRFYKRSLRKGVLSLLTPKIDPDLAPSDVSPPSDEKDKCKLCHPTRPKITHNNRSSHTWLHHVTRKRFACLRCDYGSALLQSMRDHVTFHHKELMTTADGIESGWTDNTQMLNEEYKAAKLAAFGIRRNARLSLGTQSDQVSILEVAEMSFQPGTSTSSHLFDQSLAR